MVPHGANTLVNAAFIQCQVVHACRLTVAGFGCHDTGVFNGIKLKRWQVQDLSFFLHPQSICISISASHTRTD